MANSKGRWVEVSFLSEVITGTVLALWIIFTELTRMDVYFSVVIGLILYIIFMASLIYRKHTSDKLQLETLKAQLAKEEKTNNTKIFWDANKGDITETIKKSIERNARWNACDAIIRLFEQLAKDESLSQQEREFYTKAIKRIKEVQVIYESS
jgi:hypothetical protein